MNSAWRLQSISFKQLEAFIAIAESGSFVTASKRIGTSQPAISKRISELEAALGTEVLSRSNRSSELTMQGLAILATCQEIVRLRDLLLQSSATPQTFAGRFSFGATELVASTILPGLIKSIRKSSPDILLEPVIGQTDAIFDKLVFGDLSLAILPTNRPGKNLKTVSFGSVELAWMCAAKEYDCPDFMPVKSIGDFQLLAQSEESALQKTVDGWLRSNGVSAKMSLSSNSLATLCQLTISGLGISCLPLDHFSHYVENGQLRIIRTEPPLPTLDYFVTYKNDRLVAISEWIAKLASDLFWKG